MIVFTIFIPGFASICTSTGKKMRNLQMWDKSRATWIGFSARESVVSFLFKVDAEQNQLKDLIVTRDCTVVHLTYQGSFPMCSKCSQAKNVSLEFGIPIDDLGDLQWAILSSHAPCCFSPLSLWLSSGTISLRSCLSLREWVLAAGRCQEHVARRR